MGKYITLFTCRIGNDADANIKIFQKKTSVENEHITELLYSILCPYSENADKKKYAIHYTELFNTLSYDSKVEIIKDVLGDEKANQLCEEYIDKQKDIPYIIVEEFWRAKKIEILKKSGYNRYQVYKSDEHQGVYAIDILTSGRDKTAWVNDLIKLSLALCPDASCINLAFHQGDITEQLSTFNYTHLFTSEEKEQIVDKELLGDRQLNVIAFSHTSESPVYQVLKGTFEGKIMRKDGDNTDEVHLQMEYIANDNERFWERLEYTRKEIEEMNDCIGKAYPTVPVK